MARTMREVVDTKTAAMLLDVSARTLERWRRRKKGPSFVRVGRRVMYPADSVQKYWLKEMGG